MLNESSLIDKRTWLVKKSMVDSLFATSKIVLMTLKTIKSHKWLNKKI